MGRLAIPQLMARSPPRTCQLKATIPKRPPVALLERRPGLRNAPPTSHGKGDGPPDAGLQGCYMCPMLGSGVAVEGALKGMIPPDSGVHVRRASGYCSYYYLV